jgi:hypothetical protein
MNELNLSATEVCRSPASVPTLRRRFWIHVLLWFVIFSSGGVVGTGITLLLIRERVLHAIHHPEEMPSLIASQMRGTLHLNAEQVQKVEDVLSRRQLAIQAIRRQFQPQVERELDRVETEISEVLNDQQRVRWRENFEQLRGDWVPPTPPETPTRTAGE